MKLMSELPDLPKPAAQRSTPDKRSKDVVEFERERRGGWRIPVCDGCGLRNPTLLMLKEDLWRTICKHPKEILCKKCIEQRLDRVVTLSDLANCPATDQIMLGAEIVLQSLARSIDARSLAEALFRRHAVDKTQAARNVDKVTSGSSPAYDPTLHELTEKDVSSSWLGKSEIRRYWLLIANAALQYISNKSACELPKPLVHCTRCRDKGFFIEYDDGLYPSDTHAAAAHATKQRYCECDAGKSLRSKERGNR